MKFRLILIIIISFNTGHSQDYSTCNSVNRKKTCWGANENPKLNELTKWTDRKQPLFVEWSGCLETKMCDYFLSLELINRKPMDEVIKMVAKKYSLPGFKTLEESTFIGLHRISGSDNKISRAKVDGYYAQYSEISSSSGCLCLNDSRNEFIFNKLICKLSDESAINFVNEWMFLVPTFNLTIYDYYIDNELAKKSPVYNMKHLYPSDGVEDETKNEGEEEKVYVGDKYCLKNRNCNQLLILSSNKKWRNKLSFYMHYKEDREEYGIWIKFDAIIHSFRFSVKCGENQPIVKAEHELKVCDYKYDQVQVPASNIHRSLEEGVKFKFN